MKVKPTPSDYALVVFITIMLLVAAVTTTGCCEPHVVNQTDLEALQQLQDPIFKDYLRRVDADTALEPAQKKTRHLAVEAAQDFVNKSIERFNAQSAGSADDE